MKIATVKVRLISADIAKILQNLSEYGMILKNLRVKDDLTAEFKIETWQLRTLNRIVQHKGDQIEVISNEGIYWGIRHLIRRPVMVLGILFLLILTWWLPTRVLFLQVDGNNTVPTKQILEAAANCGIGFGAKTRNVRSEKMKNALIQQIPTLQWAGINTDGCVAVISVREKTTLQKQQYRYPVSSMVAARDGYITEMTVTAGSAAGKVGQSVEKGQVLISAYTDCGTHLLAQRAEGEVYADTSRTVNAVLPAKIATKGKEVHTEQRYSILIGKKLINFENWSGIWGQECDRIKSVNYMTLPGGFQLPFALISETVIYYDTLETDINQAEAEQIMVGRCKEYLLDQMISGKILKTVTTCQAAHENYMFTANYNCNEMICQIRTEEILQTNEQRN